MEAVVSDTRTAFAEGMLPTGALLANGLEHGQTPADLRIFPSGLIVRELVAGRTRLWRAYRRRTGTTGKGN